LKIQRIADRGAGSNRGLPSRSGLLPKGLAVHPKGVSLSQKGMEGEAGSYRGLPARSALLPRGLTVYLKWLPFPKRGWRERQALTPLPSRGNSDFPLSFLFEDLERKSLRGDSSKRRRACLEACFQSQKGFLP